MRLALNKNTKNGKKALLLEMLAQLPQKEQSEIHRRLGQWLTKRSGKVPAVKNSRLRNREFLQTEFGQYVLEEADPLIPIEKVRKTLSKIKGSFAKDIIEEREERYK
jgi:hypothetical protein